MRLPWLLALKALLVAAVPQRHELSNAIEDVSSASLSSAATASTAEGQTRQQQQRPKDGAAVSRLLQVFGLREPRRRERHQQPPVYMLELYNATAGSGGITRSANKYNANLVRSFPDRVRRHNKRGKKKSKDKKAARGAAKESPLRFFFNVTPSESSKEEVLQAEFHLYKLRPKHRPPDKLGDAKSHLLEVRVYQAMPGASPLREEGHRLLDVRRMTYTSVGWEVFYVKAAAVDWIKDPTSNLGLLMTVRTAHGRRLEEGVLRFAKRHQGHVNKQPILVVFSDDGGPSRETLYPTAAANAAGADATGGSLPAQATSASLPAAVTNSDEPTATTNPRSVRAAPQGSSSGPGGKSSSGGKVHDEPFGCTRHEMYVDFEQIGWSSWIISPKGYNAYHCKGQCYFPLGQNQWPTNHATVQSIVNELSLTAGVGAPCCVPNKLYSISLLYFDENENVVLKQYDDMVAASCGCH